jgi:hypothetical protein
MRTFGRVGRIGGVVVAVVIGFLAWSTYGAWPVPQGYAFPRHSMYGGPDALYEGRLAVEDGRIVTEEGATVIWPPFSFLTVVDGEPVVRIGWRSLAVGAPVRLGGGYYGGGVLPDAAATAADWGCPGDYFLTTGPAD